MPKKKKLYEKIKNAPKSTRFEDICALAEISGFKLDRIEGSHHFYKHCSKPTPMNFQNAEGKAKPYQIRQLLAFIDEMRNEEEGEAK